jgi:hypothetical protein
MEALSPPVGYCQCGCGGETSIPKKTNASKGQIRGVPLRYLKGHHRRTGPVDYLVDEKGCWVWQRSITRDGYGQAWDPVARRTKKAHRLYYERHVGPIPEGMHIDHKCQNTRCVNPEHLEPTVMLENLRRSRHSKLSMEDARFIRRSSLSGATLGRQFGVTRAVISAIRTGRTWKEETTAVEPQRVQVYRCPVHGLIESPRWFGFYGPDDPETGMFCPINLSTDESGITDDLCDKTCAGPFSVVIADDAATAP